MRPTKTDFNMIEVEDENGRKTKVRGPMATTGSLKILLDDPEGNPLPRQLNYVSPTSTRAKIITTYYRGQPWFCRPCESFHTDGFCPERNNIAWNPLNPSTLKRKILPTDEAETIVLSASELRKCDPSQVEVKMVKWAGARLGHLGNMVEDETFERVESLVVMGGVNDIQVDADETKSETNFHGQKLYNSITKMKPKKTYIVEPNI
jgi:hypothetical protein